MERIKNCMYRDVCEDECKQSCLRYSITHYMLQKSNIPESKWGVNILIPDDCDVPAFESLAYIRDNIVNFVKGGNSLYLYSTTCGNGKTTWAIKLMLQYFNEVWATTGYNARGIFINVPNFLYRCKAAITKPDEQLEEIRSSLADVDLVIWDDVAAGNMSNYDFNTLLPIIDSRILAGKSDIYTSNIKLSDIEKYVGVKLASRILNGAKIQLKGGDKRYGTRTDTEFNINV